MAVETLSARFAKTAVCEDTRAFQARLGEDATLPHYLQSRAPRPRPRSSSFQAFCITLRQVEGILTPTLPGAEEQRPDSKSDYQLSVSLYDVAYRRFFGRQWHGPVLGARSSTGAHPKLQYNQNVYFHTTSCSPSVVVVVEIVAHSQEVSGQKPSKLSCGWTFLRPFRENETLPDLSRGQGPQMESSDFYYGTPRALFFMDEPIDGHQQLKSIPGCQLHFAAATHKSMLRVIHLLPENVLVGKSTVIPGLQAEKDTDALRKPRLRPTVPCTISGLHIHLPPSLEKFEEEVCELLAKDRNNRDQREADGTSVAIIERKMLVGVHNGWCYIQKPQTVHLETFAGGSAGIRPMASPSMRRSSYLAHRRTGSNGSASGMMSLVMKNPIHVSDLLEDPLFAIVFTIDYVIGEPLSAMDRKKSLTLARAHTRTVTVRWAAWNPFMHQPSPEVVLALAGGPQRAPDDEFVYKLPDTHMQDEESAKTAAGLLTFQWSSDEKGMVAASQFSIPVPPGSMPSVRSGSGHDMLEASFDGRRPPSGKHRVPQSISFSGLPPQQSPYPGGVPPPGQQQQAMVAQQAYAQQMGYPPMMFPPGYPPMGPVGVPMAHMDPSYRQGQQASELHELPYAPSHLPIITSIPQNKGGSGLSRAAYARLYTAGFPPITDRSGEPPEVIDPNQPITIDLNKELLDPLQSNEIILQFLAFSKMVAPSPTGKQSASTVFFTFHFYRYPQLTTERLMLTKPKQDLTQDPQSMPYVLQRMEKDGSLLQAPPGYEVKYFVDPTFLKPGENQLFLLHLARQTLHIDVWDGDSLLLIGSCAVELKYLCRCGNEAVQTTFELDVVLTEYQDEAHVVAGDVQAGEALSPGTQAAVRGKLHFRMANVGHLPEKSDLKTMRGLLPSKTQVVVSQTASNAAYRGGSLTGGLEDKHSKVARAHTLMDNREVAALLFSQRKDAGGDTGGEEETPQQQREGDEARRRKLARMRAVRQKEGQEEEAKTTTIVGYRKEKAERLRDLKTMEIYRLQNKREGILNMLSNSVTSQHVIFPSFGTAEFFEFVLRNPYNVEQTITIECSDPELYVVTNAREWRHFKVQAGLTTPAEEGMFNKDTASHLPQIFLRPKETVHIPFKYLTFIADQSVAPQGPTDPFRKTSEKWESTPDNLQSKMLKVSFTMEDHRPMAVLQLKVEPQPHVIDQTYRFHQPEHSFLKKYIRPPQSSNLPGAPSVGVGKLYCRSSDVNVISECRYTQAQDSCSVFIKVAMGASPQIKRFFIALYQDEFLTRPCQVWQVYAHALQRVDISCTEGQSSRFNLLLRGTQSSRLVRCFTSKPEELQVAPSDPFVLAAGAVHELNMACRPMKPGSRNYFLNVVDTEYHQLVRSWMVCVACKPPVVSRAFEINLPVGGGAGSSKKIPFHNPYPTRRTFTLQTDRPDLLQFREQRVEIDASSAYSLGLKFIPVMRPGTVDIMIFINDEDDKNEETFRITATYKM